jgi:hypothetical protein
MQAKLDAKSPGVAAESASGAGLDAVTVAVERVAGRPHARFSTVFSPKDAEVPRIDPPA